MDYADGVYRRNGNDNGWINYNDTNTIYKRNGNDTGWISGRDDGCATIYRRNAGNNGWVQLYPAGIVIVNPPDVTASSVDMGTKQRSYSSWSMGYARQGWCIKSQAGGEQFGVITCSSSQLAGSGKIIDPGTVRFSGTLGASGNYNATQTIKFRGCNFSGFGSGDPFGSYDGSGTFRFSWKAAGSNTPIPENSVDLNSENGRHALLNWMNNVNNFGRKLCVYNGETNGNGSYESTYSANYLSIKGFRLKVQGYTYSARSVMLNRPMMSAKMFYTGNSTPPKDDNYINMVVPEDMVDLPAEVLISKLNNGELEHLTDKDLVSYNDIDYKPVIYGVKDNIAETSPIFKEGITVQYLYEDTWKDCINVQPNRFSIPSNAKEVRLYDKNTGDVYYKLSL